jgi:hypothetical protein
MRRVLVPSVLFLICSLAAAEPDVERDATDRAREELAAGDPDAAVRILAGALGRVAAGDGQDRLRCLLGAAHLAADAPARAEEVLRAVPATSPCGARAAWLRVDALERSGRAREAAELAEALGAVVSGPDRDGPSADAVAALGRRLIADPDRGLPEGLRLLDLALGLRIGDRRRDDLAAELYDALRWSGQPVPDHLCDALLARLRQGEDPEVRARAAQVCSENPLLAMGLPQGPLRDRALARAAWDPVARSATLRRALGATPAGPAETDELAESWRDARVVSARDVWRSAGGADDLRRALGVADEAALWPVVRADAAEWLARWPADPHRAEVAALRSSALLGLARGAVRDRPADALTAYDELRSELPNAVEAAAAAHEAALVARALGDAEGARRRWEALRATFPESQEAATAVWSLARLRAFDEDRPEEALAFLRSAPDGGYTELERLRAPDVAITASSVARGGPSVHLVTRNLEQVELRLHRIDPLAWVRAGHRLEDLHELDVAAIAPDRTWTVAVPGYEPLADRSFDAPVEVPGPGLYTVTVAGPTEEARALLLVSGLRAVTRTVGPDTAVAVFDDRGRPVSGATVHLVDDEHVEGRTDASGLLVVRDRELDPAVLVEKGGSWALIPASDGHSVADATPTVSVAVELDRSVFLPGDRIGARLLALRGGAPVDGTWTVWLAQGSVTLPPVTATATDLGTATVELTAPPAAGDRPDAHPAREEWSVWGLAPGETTPRQLASLLVADLDPSAFSLVTRFEGNALAVQVRDPDDLPAVGVPVLADEDVAWTDATGTARFDGPGEHLPWWPRVHLPGAEPQAHLTRPIPEPDPLAAVVQEDLLRPGERPRLSIRGAGAVEVLVMRALPRPEPAAPPPDPWVEAIDPTLGGWHRERGTGAPAHEGWWEQVHTRTVTVDGASTVELEPLPPGDYDLVVISEDRRTTVHGPLRVDPDALRAVGMRDVGAGDVLHLVPEGGAALVTAEGGGGLLWAGVRAEGRAADVPVDARWRGEVVLAATGAGGERHVRPIRADLDPRVVLTTTPDGDGWRVRAEVRDRAGRPVDAEVSFTAWDPRIAELHRAPRELRADAVRPEPSTATTWGDGGPLRDGDEGSPIAPALLAENELRRERERARDADRTGLLSDNALAEAMLGEVPLELGSFGASGYGSGGGGGVGYGSIGVHGGAPMVLGSDHRPLPGHRDRVVWRVERTVDGVASVWFADPDALLALRATAVSATGVGTAHTTTDTRGEVTLHVRSVPPGSVEDRVFPVATVVNDTPRAVEGTLSFGAEAIPVRLAPGEARRVVATQPVPAGGRVTVGLSGDGTDRSIPFEVPLAEGTPGAEGPVTVVAAGPRALAAVALRGGWDPTWDTDALDAAGRAALAAWRVRPDPALVDRIALVRQALRARPGGAPAASAGFLAEVAAAGVLPVPAAELAEALDRVELAGSAEERLRAAWALARGGRPVPAAAELLAEADDETERRWAGRLARLLRSPEAPAPSGAGAPPLPGDDALVDWLEAHAADPSRSARVGGREVDGVAVFAGDATVDGEAFVWRGGGITGGDVGLRLARVPRGPAGRAPVAVPVDGWRGSCDPCRVALDDALLDPDGRLSATTWTVGTRSGGSSWRARSPGTYVLAGGETPWGRTRRVRVEVAMDEGAAPPPLFALAESDAWRSAGRRSAPPDAEELDPAVVAEAVLADAILGGDDSEIAAAYRRLAATAPGRSVTEADAVRAARALRADGDDLRAIALWRAVADRAFADEVRGLVALEDDVGALAAIQRAREAAGRYPLGPSVGEVSYLLPGRLLAMARDGLTPGTVAAGITPTDVRLTAAAWDRELLATFPTHPRATAAGLRLGRTLLELHAPETAAGWAARVRRAHPDDALSDALVFLEATARTEAGAAAEAEPLLRSLAEDLFPDGGGPPRASTHADDARLALARLAESRGRYALAVETYASSSTHEAAQALAVLQARSLETPPLVTLAPGAPAALEVEARGVDRVGLRAYRVDLRTLFLRDEGLLGIRELAVDGVSPAWSEERALGAGPFPERHRLALPLAGSGAWLVQLDAREARATTLVVRSGLTLEVLDAGGQRRVDVRRGGRPVPGVEVRGLSGGRVFPAVTDVRGVAVVPVGATVLAWQGDDVAFSDPAEAAAGGSSGALPPSGTEATHPAFSAVDRRLDEWGARDADAWSALLYGGVDGAVPIP